MIPFNLIWADFRRFRFGILMLVLLIAFSTALTTVVNLEERALRIGSARASETFDIVIGAPGSEVQLVLSSVFLQPANLALLDNDYWQQLQNNPAVEWASPLAFGDTYKGMPIVGTDTEIILRGGQQNLAQGRTFQSEFDAVVGSATGLKIGDRIIPIHGQEQHDAHHNDNVQYTVVGILPEQKTSWDKAILVPIETVWRIHGLDDGHETSEHSHNHGGISAIIVKPKSIAGAYQIRSQYRNQHTLAIFPAEVLTDLYATLGDVHKLLTVIGSATQLLLSISIALVAVVHLNQRKRQIAALRAFGAPQYAVFILIWAGLMIVVLAGVAFGVGFGYLSAIEIADRISAQSGFHMPIYLTLNDGQNVLALLAIASIIALIPALSTYRISPAQALRQ